MLFGQTSVWKDFWFVLHEEELVISEIENRNKVVGKMHMAIS